MLLVESSPSLGLSHPGVKGFQGSGKMEERRGQALALSGDQLPALSSASLPFISSLILMSLSGQKQKS